MQTLRNYDNWINRGASLPQGTSLDETIEDELVSISATDILGRLRRFVLNAADEERPLTETLEALVSLGEIPSTMAAETQEIASLDDDQTAWWHLITQLGEQAMAA